ncbi:uncharacterized protein Eint_050770 [Encephalitozoon intestinalis ATCC 50506]|uniref:EF-hand domain-containing protein n=1 Tax=Encephalitozoon intestinalis (strain ATCC 50506) TaxID=876142 RepID=E0S797_ENCIT|nr:uncharacterized protein Eint_050770 [Encephalitozoon intestinalis ATCC 50506]ADM11525.1 hypothetical protein Eint_050770 [Encephalitozoon intestinalis ATCC 50506]UTX45238.1 hypothetical protein GPK93_05g07830 [Encephalitozoon intestinalis]
MEKKSLPNDPHSFDIGKKGFLSYEEYRGYCLSILKQPLGKKKMGNRIEYNAVEFASCDTEISGVFDFLSSGEDCISFQTLKKATSKLDMNIPDEDISIMIDMFNSDGLISKELFSRSFE